MAVTFKKGVYHLNEERNFDFQLNRIIMWDGGRIDDIEPISQKIHNSETWKTELIQLGELAENGFEVYLFEGPGQGGVMRLQGKHFTHEWEKPVKAILDYFHLEDVTIIGASLGGMLAPRAAAFEKRISRVIA